MGVPISNVTRRVVLAASGTGPYNFTFEILAATDIAVYRDDTLLTLTTDYTVTINANGTGYVTLTATPTGATQIAIVGNRSIQRTTDFVTGGDFFANTVNDEMDQQTIFAQQNAEAVDRALKAPQTDPTSINMTLPRASVRANKTLAFDSNGNPVTGEVIGDNRGNWASGTAYNKRDIVKDASNGNVYYANTAHTSSGTTPISSNADSAKWDLIVDNASAGASASAAAASASAAATSASNASTSATNAANSASTASTQASNASTSATAAAGSASTASTQATNASNSATAAASSATSASNSASSASTSATNAASSASSASTSASNASTSATNAANSASSATSSASTATTQATNAASSATAAASSASDAATSASNAAASYDSFDDRYLGAKSTNPTVDNDGNALLTGALYFNTVAQTMRVWNGSSWQDQAASPDTLAERTFLATAGQTSYTFTGGYRVGYTFVYVNGALLYPDDIVATNGTTITFNSALALNDEVRILSVKAVGTVAIADISGLQTALDGKLVIASNLSDLNNASTARTNLGLGSIATQAANNVNITGGSVAGITDLAIADGGTGASTASAARTNLGLVIGTDVLAPNGSGASLTSLNASNLSSGTVGTARLATGTANSTTYLRGDQTWATVSGGVTSITAGNGLTGGTITSTGTIALDVYTGTSVTNTSYPIGSYVFSTTSVNVNVSQTLYTPPTSGGNTFSASSQGSGSGSLAGTWRARGIAYTGYACGLTCGSLFQRTA